MSATTETFRIDNPQHMAVARDIRAAVARLDKKSETWFYCDMTGALAEIAAIFPAVVWFIVAQQR